MERVIERRTLVATWIFNLEDRFARARLGALAHPRPYEPIRFYLAARLTPGGREEYTPPPELAIMRNASGYHLFFGEELLPSEPRSRRLPGARRTRRLDLQPGLYVVRVSSPLYQIEEHAVPLPMPNPNLRDPASPDPLLRDPLLPYTFALRPGPAYPFPDPYPLRAAGPNECPEPPAGRHGPTLLFGGLLHADGRGIAGVTVQALGLSDAATSDTGGQWVLWFPEPDAPGNDPLANRRVTIQFTLPDSPAQPIDVPDVCVVRGGSTSLPQAALRGWALRRGVGVAGATVAVSGRQAVGRTGPDGRWIYALPLNQPAETVDVTITLPDGTSQTLSGVGVRPRATVSVPTFVFA
jgi:hypothetical protein